MSYNLPCELMHLFLIQILHCSLLWNLSSFFCPNVSLPKSSPCWYWLIDQRNNWLIDSKNSEIQSQFQPFWARWVKTGSGSTSPPAQLWLDGYFHSAKKSIYFCIIFCLFQIENLHAKIFFHIFKHGENLQSRNWFHNEQRKTTFGLIETQQTKILYGRFVFS